MIIVKLCNPSCRLMFRNKISLSTWHIFGNDTARKSHVRVSWGEGGGKGLACFASTGCVEKRCFRHTYERNRSVIRTTFDVQLHGQVDLGLGVHLTLVNARVSPLNELHLQVPLFAVFRVQDAEPAVAGVRVDAGRQYVQVPFSHPGHLKRKQNGTMNHQCPNCGYWNRTTICWFWLGSVWTVKSAFSRFVQCSNDYKMNLIETIFFYVWEYCLVRLTILAKD